MRCLVYLCVFLYIWVGVGAVRMSEERRRDAFSFLPFLLNLCAFAVEEGEEEGKDREIETDDGKLPAFFPLSQICVLTCS